MNSVPPWASSSAPALRCCSPFELLDPEQLDFHPLRRDRRGVDDDERSLGAAGRLVQRPRGQLLARTGRADDQDAAVGLGGAVDGLAKLVHAGRATGQNASCRSQLLQFLHLALEPRGLQRAGRDQDQPIRLEGLFDEVIGAALDRSDRGFDVAVAGDHHHRQVGIVLLDLLEQLQAVELGALQPDVEEHQMRAAIGNLRQRRIAVACGPGAETFVVQNTRNEVANICFVVDNQNVTGHGLHLSCQLPVAAWIFVSLLVVASSSMVSDAGAFISAAGSVASGLTSTAGSLASAFGADRRRQTAVASTRRAAPAGNRQHP